MLKVTPYHQSRALSHPPSSIPIPAWSALDPYVVLQTRFLTYSRAPLAGVASDLHLLLRV